MTTDDHLKIDGQKLLFHPQRVAQWMNGRDEWESVKNLYPIYAEICDRVKELDNSISGQNDAWECRKAILVNNGYNGR